MSFATWAAVLTSGAGMGACLLVLVAPARMRPAFAGWGTAATGATGCVLGVVSVMSGFPLIRVGWLFPLAGAEFAGGAVSGLFIAVIGAVAVIAGVFTVGYARAAITGHDGHGALPVWALAALPLFVTAMIFVPLAASVTTFVALWELMALTSLVLVLADHQRVQVREAGLSYAVMTQLGFAAIVLGLVVFAASSGSDGFAQMTADAHTMPASVRSAVFVLTVIGFGSKAGLVPLHAWLPRAHPEAPSPVSALMSAAMVNLGIYGIVRVDIAMLGRGPTWWGLLLLTVGAITAVYAVLQAAVATDLKRLLAYSTSENMGLITMALGAVMLLSTLGTGASAAIALTAAFLHVVNHAAFKTLGFLSAGAVFSATGLRDLDELGGLAQTMPITTVLFGVAALGASGLPLGAGFVSEWLLLQSLIHAVPAGGTTLALVVPLSVGAIALTAGLGMAAMVKAFGVGFLARPRSSAAASAAEVSPTMIVAMSTGALICAVLAVAPVVCASLLDRVLSQLPTVRSTEVPSIGLLLRLPGIGGSMSPALLAATILGGVVVVGAATWAATSGGGPLRRAALWACGGSPPSSRMQYTATSFAEPLLRVFDDVLRPDTQIEVSHHAESRYLVERVSVSSTMADAVEVRLYAPVLRAVEGAANVVRRLHNGSVHAYLGYGALGLLVVLVVAAR